MPAELLAYGKKLYGKAAEYKKENSHDGGEEGQTKKYMCSEKGGDSLSLVSLLYKENGALGSHQDGIEGWVLSLTLGNSILFSFGPKRKGTKDDQNTQVCFLFLVCVFLCFILSLFWG